MTNPFVEKLACGARLSDDDRKVLRDLTTGVRRGVAAKRAVIAEGDPPDDVHLVMSGIAARAKTLEDGSRQIMALLLPGDFCDLNVAILGEMDHDIVTLTDCSVVDIPRRTVLDLSHRSPAMQRALWWSTLVDEGVLREWLVNMGRRPAVERLAHLFCELIVRLRAVGLADGDVIDLPLTQQELGDALGLSIVHVNRVLQSLRKDGYITLSHGRLRVCDFAHLAELATFNPNYLHLQAHCLHTD